MRRKILSNVSVHQKINGYINFGILAMKIINR